MLALTEEHKQIHDTVKKFVETEINPHVDEWEDAEIFPAHEVFKKLGDLGMLGINKPEEYGGLGLDYSYQAAFTRALGYCNCGGIPMATSVQTDMATPALARFGSDELRQQYLAPSIAGDMVACIAVSETGAGSDVASIHTHARRSGDDFIINGGKMWITNGTQADWACLLCNTEDVKNVHQQKSLICLPLKEDGKRFPGVSVARKLKKMGMKSSDTAELSFDDVRVPQRYCIGDPGQGFTYQMKQFQEERLSGVLAAPTSLRRCIQDTIDYTRQRIAFGRPLLDNQIIHYKLAELMAEVEALDALIEKAIDNYVQGEDVTLWASMAKLKGARLGRQVVDECLQYWGGMGYMEEGLMARRMRDGRLWSIGGGADEVMLSIISKHMGILPSRQ